MVMYNGVFIYQDNYITLLRSIIPVGYFYTVMFHTQDWDLDFGFIV